MRVDKFYIVLYGRGWGETASNYLRYIANIKFNASTLAFLFLGYTNISHYKVANKNRLFRCNSFNFNHSTLR